jgi:VWFA-related protein
MAAVFLGSLLAGPPADAQQQRVAIQPRVRAAAAPEEFRRATFRLDVKLVQIPVTVTDLRDHPVMGLPKSHFRVFEDEVEQEVAAFSMADAAISAGLVFDSSGSMRNHIDESRHAVEQFLLTSVAGDEYFLVRFSDKPQLVTPLTPDPDEIMRQLNFIEPNGWTAMNDGIVKSVGEMRAARNGRRVLLVLSDGADNNSRYSDDELLSLMREAEVRLFAIGLFERPKFLERLADETGGKVIWVRKIGELPDAMEKLSIQVRNEYVVGYFSNRAQNDGKYHKVRVEVQPPEGMTQVRASWRRGYVAP